MCIKSEINESIAKDFITDSSDFLKRYKMLEKKSISGHKGLRSKLLVDLIFAAECALKGLIILTSKEDIQLIYKKICTHNLTKLLSFLPENEKSNCKNFLDDIFINYSIANRYMVEVYKTFEECGCLSVDYYDTIANPEWFANVYEKLKKLHDYVWNKVTIPIEGGIFGEFDLDKIEKEHNLRINLGKKKNDLIVL